MNEGFSFRYEELQELYRIYEFSHEIIFPELNFSCGTLQNYVDTGILTEEEVARLWMQHDTKK